MPITNLLTHPYIPHLLLSNTVHILLLTLSTYLPHYSHQSLLNPSQLTHPHPLLSHLTNFDGFHYLYNDYNYLPNFAFLPGYTMLVRAVVGGFGMGMGVGVLVGVNKGVMGLAVRELWGICGVVGMDQGMRRRCVMLFIYNPAAVFFHSLYSQSIYTFLTFKLIHLYLTSTPTLPSPSPSSTLPSIPSFSSLLPPTILLLLSTSIRTTSIFLLPILGLPILVQFYQSLKKKDWKNGMRMLGCGGGILGAVVGVIGGYLWWGFWRVCGGLRVVGVCSGVFVNVYSYVQEKYWNVGLFSYYTKPNTIFILLGLPSLIFSLLFLPFLPKPPTLPVLTFISLQSSFTLLLLVTVTMTNLQSSTRFLCSHPMFYVNAVLFMYGRGEVEKGKGKGKGMGEGMERWNWRVILGGLFRIWRICYFWIGILMFCLEFPWT